MCRRINNAPRVTTNHRAPWSTQRRPGRERTARVVVPFRRAGEQATIEFQKIDLRQTGTEVHTLPESASSDCTDFWHTFPYPLIKLRNFFVPQRTTGGHGVC